MMVTAWRGQGLQQPCCRASAQAAQALMNAPDRGGQPLTLPATVQVQDQGTPKSQMTLRFPQVLVPCNRSPAQCQLAGSAQGSCLS